MSRCSPPVRETGRPFPQSSVQCTSPSRHTPAKPGEVLHNDRVDPSGLNTIDHPLEIRPFEICPAPTVVAVIIADGDVLVLTILGEDGLLRANM